jgi:acyl phosphate:glycerol-3-phosphate acyltransferase
MIAIVAAGVVGYALGMLNPAALIARIRQVDLRRIGSGNPGATNVARAFGMRWAVIVAVLDIAKGFIPAALFMAIAGLLAAEVAGVAAVLGHITSPLLRGRGGKGVATALGAVLGVAPALAGVVLGVFAIGFLIARRVGIASAIAAGALSVAGIISVLVGWYPASVALFATVIAVLVVFRHTQNMRDVFRPQPPNRPSTGDDGPSA